MSKTEEKTKDQGTEQVQKPIKSFSNAKKFSWAEGDSVKGTVLDVVVQEGKEDGTYNLWSVQTDKGMIQFTLSHSFDEQVKNYVFIGDTVKVTSLGKIPLDGGKTFNQFNLDILKLGSQEKTVGQAIRDSEKAGK